MSAVESQPSNVNETRTEIFYPEIMPDAWKDKYQGLKVGRSSEKPGEEILYGVRKESGEGEKLEVLPMDELVEAIEEGPGGSSSLKMTKEGRIQELVTQNEEYRQQIKSLVRELTGVNDRLSALESQAGVVQLTPINRPQGVEPNTTRRWDATPRDDAPVRPEPAVVAGEPAIANREPRPVITDADVDNEEVVEPERGGRLRSHWNRATGRVGGAVLGLQVRAQNGTYRILDRRGRERYVVDNEEEADAYIESEHSRTGGAVLLGGVAVIGAGVIGYWIGKHAGHDHARQFNEIISQNNTIKGQNSHLLNEVDSMKGQLDKDSSIISRMADRVHDLKQTVNDNHRILKADHRLLLDLKHHEAREAVSSMNLSGGAHTETLNHRGDTIWNHASNLIERRTGRRSNIDTIKRVTSKILNLNGLRWDGGGPGVDAHKLPVGMRIRIPNKIS